MVPAEEYRAAAIVADSPFDFDHTISFDARTDGTGVCMPDLRVG